MDPLRTFPLHALDARGALSLVLDHLDEEDDALCTALVCTTFRDVLFARFGVRAEGQEHAGKRIVTGLAGVGASAGRLEWARCLATTAPTWVRRWDSGTAKLLARVGGLKALALQWARVNGCEWDKLDPREGRENS